MSFIENFNIFAAKRLRRENEELRNLLNKKSDEVESLNKKLSAFTPISREVENEAKTNKEEVKTSQDQDQIGAIMKRLDEAQADLKRIEESPIPETWAQEFFRGFATVLFEIKMAFDYIREHLKIVDGSNGTVAAAWNDEYIYVGLELYNYKPTETEIKAAEERAAKLEEYYSQYSVAGATLLGLRDGLMSASTGVGLLIAGGTLAPIQEKDHSGYEVNGFELGHPKYGKLTIKVKPNYKGIAKRQAEIKAAKEKISEISNEVKEMTLKKDLDAKFDSLSNKIEESKKASEDKDLKIAALEAEIAKLKAKKEEEHELCKDREVDNSSRPDPAAVKKD